MNSSIAASTMAPRRSAARSARLEAGFGDGGVAAALRPMTLSTGLRATFPLFLVTCFVMLNL
jgi:hypothetical protein